MPRTKGGIVTRRRHKKYLKLSKGYRGLPHRIYKQAKNVVMKSGLYAYRDRKNKKREFRNLWITRINAACHLNNTTYSRFMKGIEKANIKLNRKTLAHLAAKYESVFKRIVEEARA